MKLKRDSIYFVYKIISLFPDKFIFGFWFKAIVRLRARILNLMPDMHIGENVKIYRHVKITRKSKIAIQEKTVIKENCHLAGNIEIGKRCNILNNTKIDGTGKVIIGDDTHIGRENDIFSHYHDISKKEILVNQSKEVPQTTLIGNNVMLFSRVAVMSGRTIEDNAVIAYGSVVTKNCTEAGIYAGVPAVQIGMRE